MFMFIYEGERKQDKELCISLSPKQLHQWYYWDSFHIENTINFETLASRACVYNTVYAIHCQEYYQNPHHIFNPDPLPKPARHTMAAAHLFLLPFVHLASLWLNFPLHKSWQQHQQTWQQSSYLILHQDKCDQKNPKSQVESQRRDQHLPCYSFLSGSCRQR